jgi:glucoamylase
MPSRKSVPLSDLNSEEYLNICNHGIIASNRTSALVGMNGTIDWACLPNFNSDPIFDSILDWKKGGKFVLQPYDADGVDATQFYIDNTNILVTEFKKEGQIILRITDFIPSSSYTTINFPEIHRYIETPIEGIKIHSEVKLSFHFGTKDQEIIKFKNGYLFKSDEDYVGLSSDFPFSVNNNKLQADFYTNKNGSGWMVLFYGMQHVQKTSDYKSFEMMEHTANFQKDWVSTGKFPIIYNHEVIRSALVLKGLIYEPTGLMVAAPTTSLPESIGGDRNYDYRFCWVRDVAYVIESLTMLGYKNEAVKFLYDVMDRVKTDGELKTIYTINNYENLKEREVDYEGYRKSAPVRIGNLAATQLQIDEYGSLINAIYHVAYSGGMINTYLWDFVRTILAKLTEIWKLGDSSIWEFRTQPLNYTYSKAIAWSAFQRGIDMSKKLDLTAPIKEWKTQAESIKSDILTNAFNSNIGSFVQHYGSGATDASLLRLPLLGFLPPNHPYMVGTIKKIESDLMVDGYLFKRYAANDNFTSGDNAFTLLSFWYVEDLIIMGKIKKAKGVLDKIIAHSNHLGLMSEEIDFKSGELLGNFPQALSHLGLIRAAVRLNRVSKNYGKIGHELKFTLF